MSLAFPDRRDVRPLPDKNAESWRGHVVRASDDDWRENLQPEITSKLLSLQAEADGLHDRAYGASERARGILNRRHDGERREAELFRHYGEDAKHPHIVAQRREIESLKEEYTKARNHAGELQAPATCARRIFHRCESYIQSLIRSDLKLAPPQEVPNLSKNEGIEDLIERTRAQIKAQENAIFDAENAPHPSNVAIQIAIADIERRASSGRPNVLATIENALSPFWPEKRAQGSATEIDAAAILFWLQRDALIKATTQAILEDSDDSSALTDTERAKKIATAKIEKLRLERIEESLITAARADYRPIARRQNADPRAVIGISDDAPEPDNHF